MKKGSARAFDVETGSPAREPAPPPRPRADSAASAAIASYSPGPGTSLRELPKRSDVYRIEAPPPPEVRIAPRGPRALETRP